MLVASTQAPPTVSKIPDPVPRAVADRQTRTVFVLADSSRDAHLTWTELAAWHQQQTALSGQRQAQRRASNFQKLDDDGNRLVDAREFGRSPARGAEFMRGDSNKDGSLTVAEYNALVSSTQRGLTSTRRVRVPSLGTTPAWFRRADANRDNRLSVTEATASVLRTFDRYDTNRDSRLTADERRVAWQAAQSRKAR